MIIVSQDRDRIVNINNITQIYVTEDEERTAYFIRVETTCETYEDLGKYYTESRVREVLQEIIRCYAATEELKCVVNINGCLDAKDINKLAENSFIYEMKK